MVGEKPTTEPSMPSPGIKPKIFKILNSACEILAIGAQFQIQLIRLLSVVLLCIALFKNMIKV